MKIGDISLKNNIFLAPMAGITDLPFRVICKKMGAGLVNMEMISAKGLYYNDEKTQELTRTQELERPVSIQIFGSDADIMANIVEEKINLREDIDIIDINMGCPAPKIVKNGDGSALLKKTSLIRDIVRKVVNVSKKPVTVKIRKGWDNSNINAIQVAKIVEEEGAKAITVHGRTRDMFYSGEADWDVIKAVKESVSIPVIGNGDIFKPEDGINMFKYTNCDAIMIGRGARGNPWIFKNILRLMDGKEVIYPTNEEKIEKAIEHLDILCDIKGEYIGVREMRKHIAWYIKGMRNSAQIKNKVNTIENKNEIKRVLLDYLSDLEKK